MRRPLRAYIELPHTSAVVMVVMATALFGLLATGGEPPTGRFALLLAAMLGGQLAIGALNEWRDRAADALDQPDKPIPRGDVSPRGALLVTAAGLLLMLAAGLPLGPASFALLLLGTGCGIAYNLGLKRTPLSWLPYLLALPLLPIWVWVTLADFEARLLWLYPLGALVVVAIHLAQALPDLAGDRRRGERGLAVALGPRRAWTIVWSAAFSSSAAIGLLSWRVGERPAPGIVAAVIAALILASTLILERRHPARVRAHVFEVLAVSAVILGLGWVGTM